MIARLSGCRLALLTGALAVASHATAVHPGKPISEYMHTAWTARDGLLGSVHALDQTSDGYLWVGTSSGLFRFDGVAFERYKPDFGALPSSAVFSLKAVPEGGIWVGYLSGGASFLKDGRATNYSERDGLPFGRVRCFAQDPTGTVWAAAVGGVARLEGQRWHTVREDWNFPSKSAWALFEDRRGTLWVAASNPVRILFLPKGERRFHDAGRQSSEVYDFAEAPDGTIFLCRENSAGIQDLGSVADNPPGRVRRIRLGWNGLVVAHDGSLWLVGSGVRRVPFPQWTQERPNLEDAPGVEAFKAPQDLTDNFAVVAFEDREGDLWVGTDGGLDRFRRRNLSWRAFPGPAGIHHFSLVAGDGGDVWAASNSDTRWPVVRMQDGKRLSGGPNEVILVYRDPAGAVWFSAPPSFIRWKAGRMNKLIPPDWLRKATTVFTVNSVTTDRAGNVWVSVGGHGEFRVNEGVWTFVEVLKDHPDWTATSAYTDDADRIWLAYPDRVAMVDHGTIRTFSTRDGLAVGVPLVIAGGGHRVWVGGEQGLALFESERFRALSGAGDIDFNSITGIVAPANDGVWLSAATGIVHVPEREVQEALRQPDHRVTAEVFDVLSDLPEAPQSRDQFGPFSSSAIEASDGSLWFTTHNGAARIDPSRVGRNALSPPVVIRSIVADERFYSPSAKPTLPPLTRNLRIDYTALSLSIPERVRFRYKLEGYDADWRGPVSARSAVYTNLPPRPYRFRVLACNNDGVWNNQGATVELAIAPTFYQTNAFLAVCAAAVGYVAWAGYRWRVQRLRSRLQAQFRERLAERTRIAQELHDTLLQGFVSASMQLHVAAENLPAGSPEKPRLNRVLELMRAVVDEARNAVMGLRSSTRDPHDLEEALSRIPDELDVRKSVQFRIIGEGQTRPLEPLTRDEVYWIGREALVNAFRHSEAKLVETEVEFARKGLRLAVRDDGRGMDDETLQAGREGHWGLVGMRERAGRIGARLKISSRPGGGTEVELFVPAAIAFGARSRSGRRRWPRPHFVRPTSDPGSEERKR